MNRNRPPWSNARRQCRTSSTFLATMRDGNSSPILWTQFFPFQENLHQVFCRSHLAGLDQDLGQLLQIERLSVPEAPGSPIPLSDNQGSSSFLPGVSLTWSGVPPFVPPLLRAAENIHLPRIRVEEYQKSRLRHPVGRRLFEGHGFRHDPLPLIEAGMSSSSGVSTALPE